MHSLYVYSQLQPTQTHAVLVLVGDCMVAIFACITMLGWKDSYPD